MLQTVAGRAHPHEATSVSRISQASEATNDRRGQARQRHAKRFGDNTIVGQYQSRRGGWRVHRAGQRFRVRQVDDATHDRRARISGREKY